MEVKKLSKSKKNLASGHTQRSKPQCTFEKVPQSKTNTARNTQPLNSLNILHTLTDELNNSKVTSNPKKVSLKVQKCSTDKKSTLTPFVGIKRIKSEIGSEKTAEENKNSLAQTLTLSKSFTNIRGLALLVN